MYKKSRNLHAKIKLNMYRNVKRPASCRAPSQSQFCRSAGPLATHTGPRAKTNICINIDF